jgi:hypothetical protein
MCHYEGDSPMKPTGVKESGLSNVPKSFIAGFVSPLVVGQPNRPKTFQYMGERIDPPPVLFVVREASREEYAVQDEEFALGAALYSYFYECTTD